MSAWIFWLSVAGVVYAYAGYPLVLSLWARLRARDPAVVPIPRESLPGVSVIVPVHNEREVIDAKLANTNELRYPDGLLEVLFVSDGSTDGTAEAIAGSVNHRIRLIELTSRGGKASGLNAGLAEARHDLIVFSDASILLEPDAISEIVQPFQNANVGCVSGEDWIPEGGGEGLYGRYELHLRRLESRLGSIVGASGSFYAQRRALCDQFIPNVAPDFLSVLITVERGFRAVTCPGARGRMKALKTPGQEFERKVRTILRGLTTLARNARLMNPFRHGAFAFALLSHKLMRWLVPIFLVAMLLASAWLAQSSRFYAVVFLAQVAFYGLACAAVYGPEAIGQPLVSRIAVYFTTVNLATLAAWCKFAVGARQEIWAPTRRKAS
jgi:cellulose synthase/poly-beta-1,6-N-acetylglucosamine synthase-like glycosyltransferase